MCGEYPWRTWQRLEVCGWRGLGYNHPWLGPLFPRPVYVLPLFSPDADQARDLERGAKPRTMIWPAEEQADFLLRFAHYGQLLYLIWAPGPGCSRSANGYHDPVSACLPGRAARQPPLLQPVQKNVVSSPRSFGASAFTLRKLSL